MAAEYSCPPASAREDESIASVRAPPFRRGGRDVHCRTAPRRHSCGRCRRLSMRALFPASSRPRPNSVASSRPSGANKATRNADGVFRSFPNGIGELVDGLMRALPKESVRLESTVTANEDRTDVLTVHVDGQPSVRARAIILSVPAFAAAQLFRPLDIGPGRRVRLDPLPVYRDGGFRVPAAAVQSRAQRHRLRGTARRRIDIKPGRGSRRNGRIARPKARLCFARFSAARATRRAVEN